MMQREGNTAESLARLSGHKEIEDYLRERAESVSRYETFYSKASTNVCFSSRFLCIAGFCERSSP